MNFKSHLNKIGAFELLEELKAPAHLITHVTLVGEASSEIIKCLNSYNLQFDANFLEVGVVLHDVGKIKHPKEMHEKGSLHEAEGEKILLNLGIEKNLARVCVSHGQWDNENNSLEELLISLSDKLWKGKRVQRLEEKIIKIISNSLGIEYWELFMQLDNCFELIASTGDERLSRSLS